MPANYPPSKGPKTSLLIYNFNAAQQAAFLYLSYSLLGPRNWGPFFCAIFGRNNRSARFPPMLNITPTADHPMPNNLNEEVAESLQVNARVAADTASLMFELGMPFEMTAEDEEAARKLFTQVDVKKKKGQDPNTTNPASLYQGSVALKLGALLNEYDKRIVLDATQARTYIMNKLLEISDCGDDKTELRALELFGKMSDVGAFTEKSEVTITHRSSGDIKQALQEKISRLLGPDVQDVTPKLAQELGIEVIEEAIDEVDIELDALAREREETRVQSLKIAAEKAKEREDESR